MKVCELIGVIGVNIGLFNLKPLVYTGPKADRRNSAAECTALFGNGKALAVDEELGDDEELPIEFAVVAAYCNRRPSNRIS